MNALHTKLTSTITRNVYFWWCNRSDKTSQDIFVIFRPWLNLPALFIEKKSNLKTMNDEWNRMRKKNSAGKYILYINRELSKFTVTWNSTEVRDNWTKQKTNVTVIFSFFVSILGFHMTSQALLKLVSAMLVSLGVKFILLIGHFYSEASLLSLSYSANYMNIQKEKNDKRYPCALWVCQKLTETSTGNIFAVTGCRSRF